MRLDYSMSCLRELNFCDGELGQHATGMKHYTLTAWVTIDLWVV